MLSFWVSVTIESEPTTNSADFDPIFPDLNSFLYLRTSVKSQILCYPECKSFRMSITMETCVFSDIVRFSYLASAIVIAVFCLLQVLCRIAAIICTAKGIFAHPKGVYLSHCCDYFFRDWFFTQKSRWKIKIAKYFRMCANRHADQISKWIVQICPCVRKSQVSWYLLIRSKRKMTKRYFGTTVLFKTVLDLLL